MTKDRADFHAVRESMTKDWADFHAVKRAVSMRMVLDHYNLRGWQQSGNELRGRCPLHRGAQPRQFTVNVDKNAFKCFSSQCNASGNVLDFVAAMENCSIRDAALKLQRWFKVGEPPAHREISAPKETASLSTEAKGSEVETKDGVVDGLDSLAVEIEAELAQVLERARLLRAHLTALQLAHDRLEGGCGCNEMPME